jgi:molybdenum cofactor cytidylyltransferase
LKNIISAIFTDYSPATFGLCGEAFLWEDYRSHFLSLTGIETVQEFRRELIRAFEALTGSPVTSTQFVFVKKYNRGGVSSGMVDPWNWRRIILPGIADRYIKYKEAS